MTQHEGLEFGFSRTRFLVFDEADRLLEATFETELRTIVQALPQRRQTLLFSATITPSLASLHATALPHAFTFRVWVMFSLAYSSVCCMRYTCMQSTNRLRGDG